MNLVPFPPTPPLAIQKANLAQALIVCNCGHWGACDCSASASLWALDDALSHTPPPVELTPAPGPRPQGSAENGAKNGQNDCSD